jgi:hypothetical protein
MLCCTQISGLRGGAEQCEPPVFVTEGSLRSTAAIPQFLAVTKHSRDGREARQPNSRDFDRYEE